MRGDDERQLELLASMLASASHALVLTGAGVSTESGLPDYRSTGGLWSNRRFEELAHIDTWRSEPAGFWRFYAERLRRITEATPNEGHAAIAKLERQGYVQRTLTQNVDGLHRAAGSREPLELHGTLTAVECLACGFRGPKVIAEAQLAVEIPVPLCPACGGNLKPAVVLFGELLPAALGLAYEELSQCDLLICCGSSLQVFPVAEFPERVHRGGGKIAVVNLGQTGADGRACVRLESRTGEALPALCTILAT